MQKNITGASDFYTYLRNDYALPTSKREGRKERSKEGREGGREGGRDKESTKNKKSFAILKVSQIEI